MPNYKTEDVACLLNAGDAVNMFFYGEQIHACCKTESNT
jgi:hypothetical protein